MDKITFTPDDNDPVDFFVLEQTTVSGINYILVVDTEEGDGDALILKDLSRPEDEEAVYEIVSEEVELEAIAAVFENILEDIDFIQENEA